MTEEKENFDASNTMSMKDALSSMRFRIPTYQRGYQWKEENVEDMLRDLFRCKERSKDHYFGTIVIMDDVNDEEDAEHLVVDGQQRVTTYMLFIRAIRDVVEHYIDDNNDYFVEEAEDKFEDMVYYRDKMKFRPATENSDIYEDIMSGRNISNESIDTLSERRMYDNYQDLKRRLREYVDDLQDDGQIDSKDDIGKCLNSLLKKLGKNFNIMLYEIEGEDEKDCMEKSSLFFECINDRGKDLYEIDKVKSYILYRYVMMEDDNNRIDPKDIHSSFVDVEENLQSLNGSYDDHVETFMKHFFMMFSGQRKVESDDDTNIRNANLIRASDRMKYTKRHIPVEQRDDGECENWIEIFIESIVDASESYKEIKDPLSLRNSSYDEENINLMYSIDKFFPNYSLCFVLATHYSYKDSSEYLDLLQNFESLVIRAYQILKKDANTKGSDLLDLANKMFWTACRHEDYGDSNIDVEDVIGGEDIETYDDLNQSVEKVSDKLRRLNRQMTYSSVDSEQDLKQEFKIDEIADLEGDLDVEDIEEYIKDNKIDIAMTYIRERCVLNDGEGENNYGGMRGDEAVARYILSEYERWIPENKEKFNNEFRNRLGNEKIDRFYKLENPSLFFDNKDPEISSLTYEHVWPDNPDNPDSYNVNNYESLKGMIGNGYILTHGDNSINDNKSYKYKYSIYGDCEAKNMFQLMPDATEDENWSEEVIKNRNRRISKFVRDRWHVEEPENDEE